MTSSAALGAWTSDPRLKFQQLTVDMLSQQNEAHRLRSLRVFQPIPHIELVERDRKDHISLSLSLSLSLCCTLNEVRTIVQQFLVRICAYQVLASPVHRHVKTFERAP